MIGAIIQARMGSSRLPNKVLLDLAGKPVLEHIIERVKEAEKIEKIIVATSENKQDSQIVDLAKKTGIDHFQGKEEDVLDRFYQTAKFFQLDDIVRITGDCPMIDPEIIDQVIDLYQKEQLDYANNSVPSSFPDGLDVEVFSFQALEKAQAEAKLSSQREHVTMYFWQNPEIFKQRTLKNSVDLSARRWTLDEKQDYQMFKKVFNQLYRKNPNFRLKDALLFFEQNPEIEKINQGIDRNEGLTKSFKQDGQTN